GEQVRCFAAYSTEELGVEEFMMWFRAVGRGGRQDLGACPPRLCCNASKSDKIRGGATAFATACPASLASINPFSSSAAWSGYAVQSTFPAAASISIPAKRSSSAGSFSNGHTVCGQTRTCSG